MSDESIITVGERISARIVDSMQGIRTTTESAVLAIGQQLNEIVRVATQDNNAVRDMFGGDQHGDASGRQGDLTITTAIETQLQTVGRFIDETRDFFKQQLAFAKAAGEACDKIASCASGVTDLMTMSHLLALNMQIESARLKEGRAISAIGEEMKEFSVQVRKSNEAIKTALQTLTDSIPRIHSETAAMDERTASFSESLSSQMTDVKRHTTHLAGALQTMMQRAEQRNNDVVKASLATLSELQFQDPMSQKLQQAEFDVEKLQQLIVGRECEDVCLADIDPAVGNDGTLMREAGEVDLF
jgi:methyl-accepting chemotaxis protein